MFKIYYASAIDVCVDSAFKQIEEFKKIFKPYILDCCECVFEYQLESTPEQAVKCDKCHKVEVYGAGWKDSPILDGSESTVKKGVICAYDLRKLRECDMLLLVTDLKTFCAGTMQELEYSRQLGIYTVIFVTTGEKVKNIFLETYANRIIYSKEELIEILEDITK